MKHGLPFAIAALLLALPALAEDATPRSAPGVTIPADGFILHRPSGLRLPREIAGPTKTHEAMLTAITPDKVELNYGPITVTISAPTQPADPVIVPPGWAADPNPPSLPSLLFWGEGVLPVTISFLHTEASAAQDFMSFAVVVDDWQIVLSAQYAPENRETIVHTAEAVWAFLTSANAERPKRPPLP